MIPRGEEGIERGVGGADVLAGVVAQALGDDLAVVAHVLDALLDDRDFHAVDGDFPTALGRVFIEDGNVGLFGFGEVNLVACEVVGDRHVVRFVVGVGNVVVLGGFLHADRIAVEILVRKKRGDVPEIHDREVVLPEVFIDAGAASDDLLELGHGADVRVEDDELTGLRVHAGGHEFRRGGDDGVKFGRADEGVEVALALVVITGDLHHVSAVGGDEVGVRVCKFPPHPLGVLDVHAEDDGLGKAVAAFEELGDLPCDDLAALLDDDVPIEVGAVVEAVFNDFAFLVLESLRRTPAFCVNVERDFDDFVGCEETVIYTLLE